MDYAIKTLSQLRPILQGFRKAAGLTQTAMAAHLGVTQQTYAQLEANPSAVSVERLFRVLRVLQVDLKLTPSGSTQSVAVEDAPPAAAKGNAIRATRAQAAAQRAATTSPGEASDRAAAQASGTSAKSASTAQKAKAAKPAKATKAASTSKKREDW
ncbi:HTH-type transcriptional regulator/antitoxin HipB [Paraburkholderia youngii]|uniref:helix-turn-helix transcriptional regulator n=1 Tax=Paraburkholderia youngii TaxID=2782701 RepID=UPI00159012F3|nr:helix-turn-helix transcriptional regulator [Paraburkholderia youngii]NUX53983.1 helix-turn-helix transcriptional regulator [Paraburkholderia youngii]